MEPGQVDIKRGYFKGDLLSPFLFVIILPTLTLVLREMKVGYKQKNMCSVVNEKAEKKKINNIKIEDQDGQYVDEAEIEKYNCLGILQLD